MLALEIGFGNGGFLIDQATTHPNQNFVGIDTSWPSVERLLHKLNRTQLGNIRVLHGDAATIVERLFAPDTIQNVWINFPDPWPKKRHQSRRLIQSPFIDQLTIATDHAYYAEHIAEVLIRQSALRSKHPIPFVSHAPNRTATKYERKARSEGKSIHYFIWQKHRFEMSPQTIVERNEPLPSI